MESTRYHSRLLAARARLLAVYESIAVQHHEIGKKH